MQVDQRLRFSYEYRSREGRLGDLSRDHPNRVHPYARPLFTENYSVDPAARGECRQAWTIIETGIKYIERRGHHAGPPTQQQLNYIKHVAFRSRDWSGITNNWRIDTDADCIRLINARPRPGWPVEKPLWRGLDKPRRAEEGGLYQVPPQAVDDPTEVARRALKRKRDAEEWTAWQRGDFSEALPQRPANYLHQPIPGEFLTEDRVCNVVHDRFRKVRRIITNTRLIAQVVGYVGFGVTAGSLLVSADLASRGATSIIAAGQKVAHGVRAEGHYAFSESSRSKRRCCAFVKTIGKASARQLRAAHNTFQVQCGKLADSIADVVNPRLPFHRHIQRRHRARYFRCARVSSQAKEQAELYYDEVRHERLPAIEEYRKQDPQSCILLSDRAIGEILDKKLIDRQRLEEAAQSPHVASPHTPSKSHPTLTLQYQRELAEEFGSEYDFTSISPPSIPTPTPEKAQRVIVPSSLSLAPNPSSSQAEIPERTPAASIIGKDEADHESPSEPKHQSRGRSEETPATHTSESSGRLEERAAARHVPVIPATPSRATSAHIHSIHPLSPPSRQLQQELRAGVSMETPPRQLSMFNQVTGLASGFAYNGFSAISSAVSYMFSPAAPAQPPRPQDSLTGARKEIWQQIDRLRAEQRSDAATKRRVQRRKQKLAGRKASVQATRAAAAEDTSTESDNSSSQEESSEDELAGPHNAAANEFRSSTTIRSPAHINAEARSIKTLNDAFRASAIHSKNLAGQDEDDERPSTPDSWSAAESSAPVAFAHDGPAFNRDGTRGKGRENFLAATRMFTTVDRFKRLDDGLHNARMSPQPHTVKLEVSEHRKSRRQAEKIAKEEEAARLVREEEQRMRKEAEEKARKQSLLVAPTRPLIPSLNRAWRQRLTAAMAMSPQTNLAKTPAGTNINRRSFGTCLPQAGVDPSHAWLNDDVIMAYLEHVMEYGKGNTAGNPRPRQDKPDVPRYVAFNNNLWNTMSSKGVKAVERWPSRAGLKGDRFMQPEIIFVPVNTGIHWTIVAIRPKTKCVEYYDSMNRSPGEVHTIISDFLASQLKDTYNKADWKFSMPACPKQNNSSDCGVFAITVAQALTLGLDPMKSYSASDMETQRQRILAILMNGGFTGDFLPEDPLAANF